LQMIEPNRAYDSRVTRLRLVAGTVRTVDVAPPLGSSVPSGAEAALVNLTAVGATASSYLTVFPTGTARPLASNLNTRAGADVANLVVAKIGTNGAIDVYNEAGSVDVVVDVVGYLRSGSDFRSVAPQRVLDTRTDTPLGTADERAVGLGDGAGGVAIVNLTSTGSTNDSFITAWPGGARPTVSSINPRRGETVANLAFVSLTGNAFRLFNSAASTHVVVDLLGFFPSGSGYRRVEPVRAFDSRPTIRPGVAVRHGFVVPAGTNVAYARTHSGYPGTDVFAACGTPILSPVDGVVSEVRRVDAYSPAHPATFGGRSVAVVGDDGVRYYGSHYDAIGPEIVPGYRVAAGDRLGTMGQTGDTSVCHLHFGLSVPCPGAEWSVRRGVVWPWPYLDAWRVGTNLSPAEDVAAWRSGNPGGCLAAMADPDAAFAAGP
jgi:hypothetical protein